MKSCVIADFHLAFLWKKIKQCECLIEKIPIQMSVKNKFQFQFQLFDQRFDIGIDNILNIANKHGIGNINIAKKYF